MMSSHQLLRNLLAVLALVYSLLYLELRRLKLSVRDVADLTR